MLQIEGHNIQLPSMYHFLFWQSVQLYANYLSDYVVVLGHNKPQLFVHRLGSVWQSHNPLTWYQRSRQPRYTSPRHGGVRRGNSRCGRGYSGNASVRWHRRDGRSSSPTTLPASRSASPRQNGSAVPTALTAAASSPCRRYSPPGAPPLPQL